MFLVYAGDSFQEIQEALRNAGISYKVLGRVFLLDCLEDELVSALSSLDERTLKNIKVSTANPEDLKRADALLSVGFKSVTIENLLEDRMFKNLSTVLGNVETFFHAIVERSSRKIFGFEALCRSEVPVWKLFKISDRIAFVTDYYCREKALLEFRARFFGSYHLFLNFHPKFLRDPLENVGELEATLETKGINPRQVVVEIDEYEGMDLKALKLIRDFLKAGSIKVALDDVGAGYAGLYQLVEIHPDIAKLDMQLVRDVHKNKLKQAIIRALVKACKDVGIRVLAEGVEKKEELDLLLELEVDLFQGFIFAKPDPYPNIKEIEKVSYNLLS